MFGNESINFFVYDRTSCNIIKERKSLCPLTLSLTHSPHLTLTHTPTSLSHMHKAYYKLDGHCYLKIFF